MKIAIVGSGAAAVGALRAIEEWRPGAEVMVLDIGEESAGPCQPELPPGAWSKDHYRELYAHLRKEHGLAFPPPKTIFGKAPARHQVDGKERLWASRWRGGLTNIWGGSVLPFTEKDLGAWPIGVADLAPYYRRVSELMGISGRRDGLNEHIGEDYVNRPPIHRPPVLEALERAIAEAPPHRAYRLAAGISRVALETREDQKNRCVYSGECMTGCAPGAIYSARRDIERYRAGGLVGAYVTGEVRSIDPSRRTIQIAAGTGLETVGPFERIFLCAGCVGSTEIVMRSLGMRDGPVMCDNAVYTFPILYFGKSPKPPAEAGYFGLTNLLAACIPNLDVGNAAAVQVYPFFDHLWRYYLPVGLWRAFAGMARFLRGHLMIGRLYVHSDHSQRYGFHLDEGQRLRLELDRPATPLKEIDGLFESVRSAMGRGGFHVPKIPPVVHATSTHYAASLAYGGDLVPVSPSGEVMPGVHLCDSAVFPDSPAASPTFTIMANACRTVRQILDG
jgi:hypothetical protein